MALVLWRGLFITPEERNKAENTRSDMRYAATREGAEKLDAQLRPARMRDAAGLHYIAKRRGVEAFEPEGDGLFNAGGKADLELEKQRMDAHPDSTEWRFILSFEKDDLQRAGYDSPLALQRLLTAKMPEIARLHNISPENLVWNAAFHPVDKHGRDHHPHAHIFLYSTDPAEGQQTKKATERALEKARSIFTNAVFQSEIQALQLHGRKARKALNRMLEAMAVRPDWAEECGMAEQLERLRQQLPDKGKPVYGYLPKEAKRTVDSILHTLTKQPVFSEVYAELEAAQRAYVEAYNDDSAKIEVRMEIWRKHFFHPTGTHDKAVLHNALIQLAIRSGKPPAEEIVAWEPMDIPDPRSSDTAQPRQEDWQDALADRAAQGDTRAMVQLARLLPPEMTEEARRLYEAAAQKGEISAYLQLGRMAESGGDGAEAIQYYTAAAQAGNGRAMYRLGKLYDRGNLVKRDVALASIWYGKAAEAGSPWAMLRMAELCTGELHEPEQAAVYRQQADYMLRGNAGVEKADLRLTARLAALYMADGQIIDAVAAWTEQLPTGEQDVWNGLIRIGHTPGVLEQLQANDDPASDAALQILMLADRHRQEYAAHTDELRAALQLLREGDAARAIPQLVTEAATGNRLADEKLAAHFLNPDMLRRIRTLTAVLPLFAQPTQLTQVQWKTVDSFLPPEMAEEAVRERLRQTVLDKVALEQLRNMLRSDPALRQVFVEVTAEYRQQLRELSPELQEQQSAPMEAVLTCAAEKVSAAHPAFCKLYAERPEQWKRMVRTVAWDIENRHQQINHSVSHCVISSVQMAGALLLQAAARRQQNARQAEQEKARLEREAKKRSKGRTESEPLHEGTSECDQNSQWRDWWDG